MERLDANVGSFESTLHKAPKVFESVRVDIAPNVLDGVIYHFYGAVGNENRVIGLATSKDLR